MAAPAATVGKAWAAAGGADGGPSGQRRRPSGRPGRRLEEPQPMAASAATVGKAWAAAGGATADGDLSGHRQ